MKRVIVFSMVLALVAGAVFAEVNVGAEVFAQVKPVFSDTSKGSKIHASGQWTRVRTEVSGQDDDGIFGAYLRIDRSPYWLGSITDKDYADTSYHLPGDLAVLVGNAWWKPIDQFKLTLGGNGHDGFFGADGITRWGFYQVAADGVGVLQENWQFSSSFYGGFDQDGAILTITPMEPLEINIGIPFWGHGDWDEAKDAYQYTHVQVAYNIDGTGKFALTYKSTPNKLTFDGDGNPGGGGTILAYFNLSSIENLGLDIGVGYTLSVKESGVTYNAPIAVGLGANYNAGDFGVKARVQGRFMESMKAAGSEKGPMIIDFDVLPSYAVNEKLSILFDAGVQFTKPDSGDSVLSWHVEPCVTVKSGWWAPNFYAGIRINSANEGKVATVNEGKSYIQWSVPIGIALSL